MIRFIKIGIREKKKKITNKHNLVTPVLLPEDNIDCRRPGQGVRR